MMAGTRMRCNAHTSIMSRYCRGKKKQHRYERQGVACFATNCMRWHLSNTRERTIMTRRAPLEARTFFNWWRSLAVQPCAWSAPQKSSYTVLYHSVERQQGNIHRQSLCRTTTRLSLQDFPRTRPLATPSHNELLIRRLSQIMSGASRQPLGKLS